MTSMSNLPRETVEEILCRIPLTSMRAVRSTCRKWSSLSKDGSFTKKHLAQTAATAREGEFMATVLINFSLYLLSVDLHGIYNDSDPSVKPTGKLISLDDSYKVDIIRVCHCEGLLLCTTKDYTRLVVWNPYTGQTRWISVEPTSVDHTGRWYAHALGYDQSKSSRAHKILRFAHRHDGRSVHLILDLISNSWRVLDVTPDWRIESNHHGLSLKGNTYWYSSDKKSRGIPDFLLCFDFTTERFGPHLPLPFASDYNDAVTLSSLREEQVAVSFQRWDTFEMEIWVTTKIEPNAVSWSKFLAVDMQPLTDFRFYSCGSFLIDEEKRAVVVFDEDNIRFPTRDIAYIIGENDYFKAVDLGKITTDLEGHPLACSYVPSSVQINQPA